MKKFWKSMLLFAVLSVFLLTACGSNAPEVEEDIDTPEIQEDRPETGPNGFRMMYLTEEARDIALEDFDYLVEIILENAPTQGIVYRRMGVTLEDFLSFARLHLYNMVPMESLTALLIDERWEEIPDDPLYIAADYLTTFLFVLSAFDLESIGHFGPQSLESYESMFLGNSVIQYDPEAADFTGDMRNIERILSYFSAPATLWLYGTDPSEFDLTTDLSDVGTREEDNLTMEILEPGSIAYLHIASFLNSPSFDSEKLFPFFEEIQNFEHLIIDIRGNGGGWADYVRSYVVAQLISEPVDFRYYELHMSGERAMRAATYSLCEECIERDAQQPIADLLLTTTYDWVDLNRDDLEFLSYAILRHTRIEPAEDNTPFAGEIWLLVDGHSASASEIFAMLSLYSGFATVVGEPTAGVTGVMTTFVSLPHTGVLFRVDTGSKIDATGRAIEEFGVQPDILIGRNEDALSVVRAIIQGDAPPQANEQTENTIYGTWICTDDTVAHQWMCEITFTADGRFVDKDGDQGDFHIDGNTLTLDFDAFRPITLTFQVRGNQLSITGSGIRVTLERQ